MKIYPIFIPFAGCKTKCLYCQQNLITKTVAPDFEVIRKQLAVFCTKYRKEKKEIAFYGGSFTLLTLEQQESYLKEIADFIPLVDGIRISTRPDGISESILSFARRNKITVIELGVQSFADRVLMETNRPYSSQQAYSACGTIKNAGFTLGIQLMPWLPADTKQTMEYTLNRTLTCKPAFVRIYPALVLKGTGLEESFWDKKYHPPSLEEAVLLCADWKVRLEKEGIKVVKIGLHSDLSAGRVEDAKVKGGSCPLQEEINENVVAGPYHPSFSELVSQEILFRNVLNTFEKGKAISISPRAVSLFKRDNERLIKKIKNSLTIDMLPVIVSDIKEKEKVFSVEKRAEFLW